MDMDFSEEQKILMRSAKDFLARESSKAFVKEMRDHPMGYTPELWTKMADLGWLGVMIPEAYGGTGGSFLDLAVLLEAMGAACLPGPYFSTVVLGANAILKMGTPEQKERLLPGIAGGEMVLAFALAEPGVWYEPENIQTTAVRDGEAYVLTGAKHFVENAQAADAILCAARVEKSGTGPNGLTLFLVDPHAPGVRIKPFKTLGYDRQCEVILDAVRVEPNDVLGESDQAGRALEEILNLAAVGKCAEMLGAAQAAFEMSVAYAKEREQFGRPIGSFQAVQHHLANMAVDVDSIRFITYQAAWKIAEGLPWERDAAMAKAFTSEAAPRITRFSHQIHGAIGFCDEHDLHLYYRKVKSASLAFGNAEYSLEKVARASGL